MKKLKKLTILHSNDMHGDFLAESVDDKLIGGVSLLSGYVNKVRRDLNTIATGTEDKTKQNATNKVAMLKLNKER